MDELPNPVHFFLDDSSNIWANRAMDEFLGYERGEVGQLQTTDIYFEYAKEQHEKLVREFLELGHARGEIMVGRKDGRLQEVTFQSTANVLPGIHLTIWDAKLSAILHRDHFSWPAAPVHPSNHLTRRELEVIALLADGAGNAQVAAALGIAETTVQQHADSLRDRLGAANRSEAISRAIAAGFIRPKLPGETVAILSGESRDGRPPREATFTYFSPGAVAAVPALGRLLGSSCLIVGEDEPIEKLDDRADEPSSILLVDDADLVHLHGPLAEALGPGSHGHLEQLGPGLGRLVISRSVESGWGRVIID